MRIIIKKTTIALSLLLSFSASASNLYWNEPEALTRLATAEYNGDFAELSNYHQTQENKLFCGAATAATILNSLFTGEAPLDESLVKASEREYLPGGDWSPVFHLYTQNTVLAPKVKTRMQILGEPYGGHDFNDYGLQLHQFAALLKSHGAKVTVHELNEVKSVEVEKKYMLAALADENKFLAINYDRKVLNQKGSGHISPVSAYDEDTDSFLVMDVTTYKHMWHWVDAEVLIKAMNTKDIDNYRGYVVVGK